MLLASLLVFSIDAGFRWIALCSAVIERKTFECSESNDIHTQVIVSAAQNELASVVMAPVGWRTRSESADTSVSGVRATRPR